MKLLWCEIVFLPTLDFDYEAHNPSTCSSVRLSALGEVREKSRFLLTLQQSY